MIAAKFPYNQVHFLPYQIFNQLPLNYIVTIYVLSQKLVDAFRKIPRASWSGKERFVNSVGSIARYFYSTAKLDAFCETNNFLILLYLIFQIIRVWMFPPTSLSTAEEVLREVPGLAVEVLLYM
jgi:hypothetical protein